MELSTSANPLGVSMRMVVGKGNYFLMALHDYRRVRTHKVFCQMGPAMWIVNNLYVRKFITPTQAVALVMKG
ncbi:hypothetical protein [Pantoea phage PA-1]